jgi:SAM-dependent methyltransferase
MVGAVLVNGYVREILGKKTYGRILNVGAGSDSALYRYDKRLRNSEYHTLEPTGAGNPTYTADARNMPEVPSESYDWVIANAVLEHVDDMHAVVREITRVLKPDGCVYLSVPFHNDLHFTRSYGDYWRVSPFGFKKLLGPDYAIEEFEYWGECVIDPVAIGVIARKGGAAAEAVSRLMLVEGGLDTIHRYVDGNRPFCCTMPIWRMTIDGLEFCLKVQDFRSGFFSSSGQSLTSRVADRLLFHDTAVLEGTISYTNQRSEWLQPGVQTL